MQAIREILYTDIGKLAQQLNHHTAWKNKKDPLLDSFMAHAVNTGTRPKTSDKTPIGFGDLKGLTTWQRAGAALRNHHVADLEDFKTFYDLQEKMVKEYPELDELWFTSPLQAKNIFNGMAKITKEIGVVPQECLFDELKDQKISGKSLPAIALAFRYNAVQGLESYMSPTDNKPESIEDFAVLSGLGVWRNGVLEIAA
jgi:hypothetical protein